MVGRLPALTMSEALTDIISRYRADIALTNIHHYLMLQLHGYHVNLDSPSIEERFIEMLNDELRCNGATRYLLVDLDDMSNTLRRQVDDSELALLRTCSALQYSNNEYRRRYGCDSISIKDCYQDWLSKNTD